MGYKVINAYTKQVYVEGVTLQQARAFCSQRLLRQAASREGCLSNLAAGYISVYDASGTALDCIHPGF
jgi:hypothetical protein